MAINEVAAVNAVLLDQHETEPVSSTYVIRPASGDSYATVYSSSNMTADTAIGTLPKGETVYIYNKGKNYYEIDYRANATTVHTYKIKCNSESGVIARFRASDSSMIRCYFKDDTIVEILDEQNGKYYIRGNSTSIANDTGWVDIQYVVDEDYISNSRAYISINDVNKQNIQTTNTSDGVINTEANTTNNSSNDSDDDEINQDYINQLNRELAYQYEYDTNFNEEKYRYNSSKRYVSTEEHYKEEMWKMNFCFGTPPKYNMDIDIQYVTDLGMGRVLGNTYYANPTVLSICPGKVKMFPHLFNKSKREAAFNSIYNAASGESSVIEKIMADKDNDLFNGSLYEFTQDTEDYAKRVNLLCRACAVLLGIGDEKMPYTSVKLVNFDYTYWSIRKSYTPQGGGGSYSSIFTNFVSGLHTSLTGGITDQNYIHFLVSNENTQVSENISTSVEDSFLAQLFSGANSLANQLSYFSGIGFNDQSDAQENIQHILNGVIGENGWTKLIDNVVSGGKLKIPQIVGDTNYQQSASCSLTFVSPYGSPLAVFLWCIVPICHLYAFALPKQLSDSMYSYPYILKVYQKGWFNSNLAVMSSINMIRGGSDGTSWSSAGLATEWTVNFEISPLYSQLTMPSTDHPLLFIRNDGLVDFLGNMCGFDLKASNLDVKANLLANFVQNRFVGIPNDILRWTSDKVSTSVSKIFHLG